MFDLGTSFLASVARDPACARDRRWRRAAHLREWYRAHFRAGRGLRRAGSDAGRPSRHGAAEPVGSRDAALGLPVRRHRDHADQLAREGRRDRFLHRERRSKRIVYRGRLGRRRARICEGADAVSASRSDDARHGRARASASLLARTATDAAAAGRRRCLVGDALHVRHHRASRRACRAAIAPNAPPRVAHVAQNMYGRGERTLGVMPLYHTMGVRSLIAMSLIGGAFVCLPRFDAPRALDADRGREDHQSLSGADALSRPRPP